MPSHMELKRGAFQKKELKMVRKEEEAIRACCRFSIGVGLNSIDRPESNDSKERKQLRELTWIH